MTSASQRQFSQPRADSAGGVEERARELVNPASGLANDYLNIFNELVMLVEQLPDAPEFADDIFAWRPRSYQEYFSNSNLPGSQSALAAFARLDACFREEFEAIVKELDRIATGSVVAIRRLLKKDDAEREALIQQCAKTGALMRDMLQRATNLVDHGSAKADEDAQRRADRLLAVRIRAIKDVEEFHSRPRFA